jgi:hypothetical protein
VREGVELQEQISFVKIVVLYTLLSFVGIVFYISFYIEYAHVKFADDVENSLF